MKQYPLVSVVVTCYNYGKYLDESVSSALHQTYKHVEVIIINDGSTDNTDEVAKQLAMRNKNVRYITQDNKGVVATRNRGLKEVKGEFYLQLDADDYLDPDYIEKTVNVAERENADIVYTDFKKFGATKDVSAFPEYNLEILKNQNFIHISSLVRVKSLNGIRFDEVLTGLTHEDWDFFLTMCVNGAKAIKCSETFLNYRIHNLSRNNHMKDMTEGRRYIDVYSYIIRKHMNNGRAAEFEYLSGLNLANWYVSLDNDRMKLLEKIEKLNADLDALERAIIDIRNSKPYRVGKAMTSPLRVARRAKHQLGEISRRTRHYAIASNHDKQYERQLSRIVLRQPADEVRIATIVHLYYIDNWELFARKIRAVSAVVTNDLFVTLPVENEHFRSQILQDFPNAHIITAPNHGRDVLPFIRLAKFLHTNGYRTVLKFHSKKSTHRTDGQDWLVSMLDQIIPEDAKVLKKIINTVQEEGFGILGPADVYYPLTVNYPANKHALERILTISYGGKKAKEVLGARREYGFYGGTMFWINLDQIEQLLSPGAINFEIESGQIDGTFAHALERAFCVIPEINGVEIYESDGTTVRTRAYATDNIPDWSTDHDKE